MSPPSLPCRLQGKGSEKEEEEEELSAPEKRGGKASFSSPFPPSKSATHFSIEKTTKNSPNIL